MLKDYYQILQIEPHSTLAEIKQAFRRLALIYHPDKNPNDKYAEVQFNEIKEAYEVLTNPVKKENYLQQRWYNQSIGKRRTAEIITPVSILKLVLELERYVSRLDVHRMNKEGLSDYIDELLSTDTIKSLKHFNEPEINRQIVASTLSAMQPLTIKFVGKLTQRLESLADDETSLRRTRTFLRAREKAFLWDRYKVVVIILFTILICLLIYFTSK
ncbi:MAG TPA: J domain-containing protein [Chitinophagaceae bacterium]|jgi:curved DNA-binding protein CbpA|nr:J domain-containing protein [Chitinophagaceae bacterium]